MFLLDQLYSILLLSATNDQGLRSVLESASMNAPLLLLASNSPRRRQLLDLLDWKYRVQPANIIEVAEAGEDPAHYVKRLARSKAQAVSVQAQPDWLVLAADTIVVDGDAQQARILEKPIDAQQAFQMLAGLRGRSHRVFTALAVFNPISQKYLTDLCITKVPMRPYSDEEISDYISSGDPMDKAGAYAIQHASFHPVEHLQGCYTSVMGLPLCHLLRLLQPFGFSTQKPLAQICQSTFQYRCPVSDSILAETAISAY